jgi:hypothetical protein
VITLVQRYLAEGEAGLERRSRRPRHSPNRTPVAVEDEIVAIRKELDREGRRRGHDRLPPRTAAWRDSGGLDDLADLGRPRVRHSAAAQTTDGQLRRVPGRATQRALATRHHLLAAGRRHCRGDPQHDRRPLPPMPRQPRPADVQRRRRGPSIPQKPLPPMGIRRRCCPRTQWCSPAHRAATAASPSRSPSPPAASASTTAGPTTCRPAARSNAATKPSKMAHPPATGFIATPAATLTRRLPHLLQRPATAPRPGPPHPRPDLHRQAEARPHQQTDRHRSLAHPPRPHRPLRRVHLRHRSRLHHIGVGRRYAGTRILVLIHDLDIRVLTTNGELICELRLNPDHDYQPQSKT